MDGSVLQVYLSDVLHAVAQSLLAPDIIMLLAFIGYALFCIGSIIAERFSERSHFKVVMPKFLAALMAAKEEEIPAVIQQSGLLKRQKIALLTVYDYRTLPGDALVALIRRLVSEEETRYDRITGRNNMAARITPMLGLMGTLIPLGPGIKALGEANTEALSSSLLVAFDTTVAGLVAAAVCMVVGKIRSNWYSNYMSALDSAMATMLQKIEDMRAQGKITVKEPTDYAFLYESKGGKKSSNPQVSEAPASQGLARHGSQNLQMAPGQEAGRVQMTADPRMASTGGAPSRGTGTPAVEQDPRRAGVSSAQSSEGRRQAAVQSGNVTYDRAYADAVASQSVQDYSASRYSRSRSRSGGSHAATGRESEYRRQRSDADRPTTN